MHGRFYLDALPIGIGLIGPGLIGSTLMDQLNEQASSHVFEGFTGRLQDASDEWRCLVTRGTPRLL